MIVFVNESYSYFLVSQPSLSSRAVDNYEMVQFLFPVCNVIIRSRRRNILLWEHSKFANLRYKFFFVYQNLQKSKQRVETFNVSIFQVKIFFSFILSSALSSSHVVSVQIGEGPSNALHHPIVSCKISQIFWVKFVNDILDILIVLTMNFS